MPTGLKPYSSTKPSGVGWLGEVPSHWTLRRLRATVDGCVHGVWGNEPNGRDDLVCVRVADFDRERFRILLERKTMRAVLPNERTRRLLRKGDLLLEKSGGGDLQPVGAVMLYEHDDLAVCSNFVARMPVASPHDSRYLAYLHSHVYALRLNARSIKQTTGIQNLDSYSYLCERVALPPSNEQSAIARFLDHMDRRIQKYIRAKEKLIALLDEYKQALIHQVVTGQIDVRTGRPYGEYKESGVEWLGRVPRHWSVVALRRRWSVTDCKHLTVPFVDCGVPLASVRQVQSFELDLGAANHTTSEWFDVLTEGGRGPKVEDLIFCRNVSVGSAALVTTEEDFAMGQDVCLIRSRYENQRWLNYYVHSNAMSEQIKLGLVGSTFNRINIEDIKALLVLVPPVDEQGGIASFLDYETKRLDTLIWNCGKQQEAMREYRTRLIADVVTGKLDVREAAASLPDLDPIDDDRSNSPVNQTDSFGLDEATAVV